MDRKILGLKIRNQRINLRLTQEQLAEKVDLSPQYIGFIERGEKNITLEKLISICNCLNLTPNYLLSDNTSFFEEDTNDEIFRLLSTMSDRERNIAINIIRLLKSE